MKKILVSPSSFGDCGSMPLDLLNESGYEVIRNPFGRKLTESETISLAGDVIGAVSGVELYNLNVLDNLPNLKCISRVGVGIDNIDLESAKKKGIEICITPNGPTQAVAELSIAMALSLLRRIPLSDRRIRNNVWKKETGNLIAGKKVGVIGLGRIGKAAAILYKALGCSLFAYDQFIDHKWIEENSVSAISFEELLKVSDIITIHVPMMENGKYLIDKAKLSLLKKDAILINLSRGGVVEESALFEHLSNNLSCSAALDVFEVEPYKGQFIDLDNVLLTPHIGSYAKEAKLQMEIDAVENLINYFRQL
jgi:D-3-phosphoglycerate dehydrogenase